MVDPVSIETQSLRSIFSENYFLGSLEPFSRISFTVQRPCSRPLLCSKYLLLQISSLDLVKEYWVSVSVDNTLSLSVEAEIAGHLILGKIAVGVEQDYWYIDDLQTLHTLSFQSLNLNVRTYLPLHVPVYSNLCDLVYTQILSIVALENNKRFHTQSTHRVICI